MNFGDALAMLKAGCKVTRDGWNGKGMWVAIEDTTKWSASNMRPFVYMKCVDGQYVPWVASQSDLLAGDWQIVPENEPGT